jgi:hypothetical protein
MSTPPAVTNRRIAARLLGAVLTWPAPAPVGAVESAEERPLYQPPEPE